MAFLDLMAVRSPAIGFATSSLTMISPTVGSLARVWIFLRAADELETYSPVTPERTKPVTKAFPPTATTFKVLLPQALRRQVRQPSPSVVRLMLQIPSTR